MKTRTKVIIATLGLLATAVLGKSLSPSQEFTVYLPMVQIGPRLAYGPMGYAGWDGQQSLRVDAWYNWGIGPSGVTYPNLVRMIWCAGQPSASIINAAQYDADHGMHGRVWLIFNEPDDTGQCGANTSIHNDPAYAADVFTAYAQLIKSIDPSARTFAPGVHWLHANETRVWWDNFLDRLQSTNKLGLLDGVAIHLYPSTSPSDYQQVLVDSFLNYTTTLDVADDWYANVHLVDLRTANLPIWITEVGWLDCTRWSETNRGIGWQWVATNWTARVHSWAPTSGFETVLWFSGAYTTDPQWHQFWCSWAVDENNNANAIGEMWR